MTADPGAQRGRDREGQQKVGARQQTVGLGLEPSTSLVLLASRTMPVAAGATHGVLAAARRATIKHSPQLTRSTGHDRLEDLLVLRGHRRTESLEIGRAVPSHHVGYGRHRTTPTSSSRWPPVPVRGPGRSNEDRSSSPATSCDPGTAGSSAGSHQPRAGVSRNYAGACGS
jgi:hypothetical protein